MVTMSKALPRAPSLSGYMKRLQKQALDLAYRILDFFYRWDGAYREILKLREMDERLLEDIGLTRQEAQREADKLLWRH